MVSYNAKLVFFQVHSFVFDWCWSQLCVRYMYTLWFWLEIETSSITFKYNEFVLVVTFSIEGIGGTGLILALWDDMHLILGVCGIRVAQTLDFWPVFMDCWKPSCFEVSIISVNGFFFFVFLQFWQLLVFFFFFFWDVLNIIWTYR